MSGPVTMTPEARDLLAAEYAVGLLAGPDHDNARSLAESDPAFAALIDDWRLKLAELDETAPILPADDALWQRIASAALARRESDSPAIQAATAPARKAPKRSFFDDLWESLSFWRFAGLAGAAAAIVLAIGLGVMTEREMRTPVLVAVLVTDQNNPAAIVNAFADGRTELVPLQDINVPEGRALEIWTLWDKAVGPRSIGLINRAQSTRLRVQDLPLGPNQLFEITLEPAGGSPIGRPTGPILMKGLTSQAL